MGGKRRENHGVHCDASFIGYYVRLFRLRDIVIAPPGMKSLSSYIFLGMQRHQKFSRILRIVLLKWLRERSILQRAGSIFRLGKNQFRIGVRSSSTPHQCMSEISTNHHFHSHRGDDCMIWIRQIHEAHAEVGDLII